MASPQPFLLLGLHSKMLYLSYSFLKNKSFPGFEDNAPSQNIKGKSQIQYNIKDPGLILQGPALDPSSLTC